MLHGTNINKLSWESISAAVAQMVAGHHNYVVAGPITQTEQQYTTGMVRKKRASGGKSDCAVR